MESNYVIIAENLHKVYKLKGEEVHALRGVNLKVKRGEYVTIVGPSGSGKTTLFNILGALDRPTRGRVIVEGKDLSKLSEYELAVLRNRKIGYIFQTFNLIPVLTALENVMVPMILAGVKKSERVEKAKRLLEMVGLGDRINHKPSELSGGQQQRVAIARALANDPSIILADEPTANLDLNTGFMIIELLKKISVEKNVTVISNTHDLKMIGASDRLIYLRDGQIEREEVCVGIELGPEEVREILEKMGIGKKVIEVVL